MNNKTKILAVVGVIALVVIGAIIYTISTVMPTQVKTTNDTPNTATTRTIVDGPFTVTAFYAAENAWQYKISAQLPTPCHEAAVAVSVAESMPEQVTIRITQSNTAEMCAQVIQEFSYEGTFSASKEANIQVRVE